MKKIMMLFLVLLFFIGTKDVFAQDQYELTLEKQDGIYFSRHSAKLNDSHPYYLYKFGNILAYCIEPGKHISTYTYVPSTDYVDLPFSEELKEKLELIGYYGRDYPGHDNIRYSMATQALIWELTGVDKVTYWTKQDEKGEEIDVSKERDEIMNLVNNHKVLPNFKSSYQGYLKKEIVITDTNKVLDNYEIENSDIGDMYIENNSLHIIPKKIGEFNISLKRKNYDEYNTIIFVGKGDNSSQKLGRLRFNKEIKTNININVQGFSLLIQKVNENNESIKVPNIKFKIKDITNNKYLCQDKSDCIYSTDANGSFIVDGLDYGEYEIEELENQVIQGYSWNKDKLRVVINEKTSFKYNDRLKNYIDLKFKNNSVLGSLELYKKGEKPIYDGEITFEDVYLNNISFDLYTSDNKFIKTIVTNSNGYVKVDNLKIGKYYLIEKNNLDKYVFMDKILFEIKQDNQYQTSINYKLVVKNILKKGKLEFSKVDSITNKGISDTIIEIYSENNQLLLTKKTNDDGKIIIENLPFGKYYIKEKEANYYYEKTNDKINFEIKKNNEVVKKTMANNKIVGNLEINKLGENYHFVNNDIIYENELLHGIEFEIYDSNNKLIKSVTTNKNGYAKCNNLPLGKYYIKEKTSLDKYVLSDKYAFEIKKDGNKAIDVKLDIINYLKKGHLEFSKIDLVTSEGIPNTIIEIYNDKDMLIFTKETDENGKAIINNLPLGRYYIIEKEANSLYKITNEKVYFEIKENGEIVKANMTNEKIEVLVPKTQTNDGILANSFFGICFLIGIGRMYYEKKTD